MARPGKIYLQIDVNYFEDSDVIELSDEAQLLDLKAMLLTKRLQSDGRLTRRQFDRIAPRVGGDVVGELVQRGIWVDQDGRLERRNWLAWNDSAESIETVSRGGKHGNHIRHHVKGKKPPSPKCQWCIDEGLVSPPDHQATSPRVAPRIADIDVDTDEDIHEKNPLRDAGPKVESPLENPRALAERIGELSATVEQARAQLEQEGFDDRTITTTLSLLPNLRRAP
jgi:hypothetical protein